MGSHLTIASAEFNLDGGGDSVALDGDFDNKTQGVTAIIDAFEEAGVHDVCVRAMDSAGNQSAEECLFLVAYDPDDGFVTGGGWIWSVKGSCLLD